MRLELRRLRHRFNVWRALRLRRRADKLDPLPSFGFFSGSEWSAAELVRAGLQAHGIRFTTYLADSRERERSRLRAGIGNVEPTKLRKGNPR